MVGFCSPMACGLLSWIEYIKIKSSYYEVTILI